MARKGKKTHGKCVRMGRTKGRKVCKKFAKKR